MQMDNEKLFVYGSLQPGAPNEHVLSAVEGTWEAAHVKGRLVDVGWGAALGYPGLVIDSKGRDVHGQLLTSPALGAKWKELDQLEGEEYSRTLQTVFLRGGTKVQAYVYVLTNVTEQAEDSADLLS